MKKIAVYPGSFDPITNGHLDILKRALDIFDEVIVLVGVNPSKKYIFSTIERVEMIKECVNDPRVKVDSNIGLTVKYAKDHGATHIIRGLRAVTDFEYEFQLAAANDYAAEGEIDSVFLMSKVANSFISSSSILELYRNGIDVSNLVPAPVLKRLKNLK